MTSWIYRNARRVVIAVVGSTVLLLGVAMIVLPGPAFLVIPAGLGILAVEFAWAREMLRRVKEQGNRVLGRNAN
jgi:tellurite resistance protein TerC